jgi:hypothetical protein
MVSFLRVSRAAAMLGVSPSRVGQLARGGVLQPVPTDLGRLYPASEVRRLAEERRRQAQHDRRVSAPPTGAPLQNEGEES